MKSVVIIPSRKNSQRIKNKAHVNFIEKPICQYTLDLSYELWKERISQYNIIATDDQELIEKAHNTSYECFLGYMHESDSKERLYDKIIKAYKESTNEQIEYIIILYTCSPFTTIEDIKNGINILEENKHIDAVFPIIQNESEIEYTMCKDEEGKVNYLFNEYKEVNSNSFKKSYRHAGQWFIVRANKLEANNTLLPKNSIGIEYPWFRGHDINTLDDLEQAKVKYLYWKLKGE